MEIKRDVSYTKNIKCQDVYTESHADYILPDYQGDVRKILFTEASLRPSGRFAGGDEVELSGVVVYNVIYLDSDGDLSSAEFTSDYDYSVKCSGESYKDSVSETNISNFAIRLIGPRKMSARASLVGSVRLSESDVLEVSGDAFDGECSPEVNTKNVKIRKESTSKVTEREFAESLTRLDGIVQDEVKVVYSRVEPQVESLEMEDEAVRLRGKLSLLAVIRVADESARTVERQISFDESLGFEGLSSDMKLMPEITVSSVKTLVNADENGCEVVSSAILELCAVAESNESVELTLDSYLKSCPTDNTYSDFNYQSLVDVSSVIGMHNAEIEKSELESVNIDEIVFLSVVPKVERVELCRDRVDIVGELRYSGVASEVVDGKTSYVGVKFTSPFATNVNTSCQNHENLRAEAKVTASFSSATVDANRVYAGCSLESTVILCADSCESVLSSSKKRENEKYEKASAVVTVYYPSDDDTLFSVAKRFRTSGLKIARDNDISEAVFAADNENGSLKGIKKILIY